MIITSDKVRARIDAICKLPEFSQANPVVQEIAKGVRDCIHNKDNIDTEATIKELMKGLAASHRPSTVVIGSLIALFQNARIEQQQQFKQVLAQHSDTSVQDKTIVSNDILKNITDNLQMMLGDKAKITLTTAYKHQMANKPDYIVTINSSDVETVKSFLELYHPHFNAAKDFNAADNTFYVSFNEKELLTFNDELQDLANAAKPGPK